MTNTDEAVPDQYEDDEQPCGEGMCRCDCGGGCPCGCDCPGDGEWKPGECDHCYGGDENGVTATGPFGAVYCACVIGQGADPEDCRCEPPEG